MPNTQANSFIDQFTTEIHNAFQQTESKLVGAVRCHRNIVGSTYQFQTLGAVTANTKARNAAVTGLDPAHAKVPVTLADYYAPIYLDKLDEIKTNLNLRQDYVNASVGAINRALDDIIITAATAGTTTTTTTAGGMTYAKIVEALTYLNTNNVDETDRFLVLSPAALGHMLSEIKLTSSDYASLQAVMSGQISQALGFKWIMSSRLPIATTTRTCFAYNKSAVGLAVGQDVTTEVNYIPEKASWLVNSMLSAGAVMIDNAGLVEIAVTEP